MGFQRQTLSLSQQQRLQMVLAPQLRQSLEMLQAPVLELRAMIQKELEQNPTLEEPPSNAENLEIEGNSEDMDTKEEMDFSEEFEVLAKLDEEWREYFFQNMESRPYTSDQAKKHQFMLDSLPSRESLQEHLLGQIRLTELSPEDMQIGEMIVGNIDDDGYLTTSLEEMAEAAAFDLHQMEDIVAVVQDFHPTGVGARDLRECLLLQLERLGKSETLAGDILRDQFQKLGGRKYNDIARALRVSVDEVQKAAQLIATLDPKPGRIYSEDVATYIYPELAVHKMNGEYVVIMDDDQLPHVRISKHYRRLLTDPNTKPEVKSYIREKIRAGALLVKSIDQRQKTIHRIATEIVHAQCEFLDDGIAKLKPLTMAEVARTVGVHETTVSRAVSGKYIKTPNGIFELKYFFTPGIQTADGTEVSNKTVKDMIANLVAAEDPEHPLSDQELMAKLKDKGIKIARRTIAKYRLVLRIPPSHMRKMY